MDLKKTLTKPLINGGLAGVGLSVLAGEKRNFIYNGQRYPVYLVGGAIGFASSFAVESVSNMILPHIPGNAKYQHLESMVLHIAGSGAAAVGAAYLLNPNLNMQEAKLFASAGIAGEVLSSYIYNNFIDQELL